MNICSRSLVYLYGCRFVCVCVCVCLCWYFVVVFVCLTYNQIKFSYAFNRINNKKKEINTNTKTKQKTTTPNNQSVIHLTIVVNHSLCSVYKYMVQAKKMKYSSYFQNTHTHMNIKNKYEVIEIQI